MVSSLGRDQTKAKKKSKISVKSAEAFHEHAVKLFGFIESFGSTGDRLGHRSDPCIESGAQFLDDILIAARPVS